MRSKVNQVLRLVATAIGGLLLAGSATGEVTKEPLVYPALAEPKHKPIFHNAVIDAYQVRLQEGEGSFYHLHSRDQLGITMRSFTSANQVLGQPEQTVSSAGGGIVYLPHSALGGTTHRVRAITGEMWVIGIEFAEPAPPGTAMKLAAPGDPGLEFPQGRAVRLRLAPGESRAIAGELLLPMTPGTLQAGSSGELWTFKPGELKWIAGSAAGYRNGGAEPVELIVLDLN